MKILKTSALAGLILYGVTASATLGEKASSIQNDVSKIKTSQKAMANGAQYSIHEMVVDGNTIKEYSNADGLIFAVSWRGIAKPDLSILFGSYYDEYMKTLESAPKQPGRRSVSMSTSRMVVRRAGHMRDQKGFAHVPSLVPPGLNLEDLQ